MNKPTDKRIIRTRKSLQTALLQLMKTKNIRDITIKELVNEAGINRSTFYLHYSCVQDILEELQNYYLNELEQICQKEYVSDPENNENGDSFSFVVDILMLNFNNLDLCHAIFGSNGDIKYQEKITRILEKMITERITAILGHEYKVSRFLSTFYLQGCIKMLQEWTFQTHLRPKPEKMAFLIYRIIMTYVHYMEGHPEIDHWLLEESNPSSTGHF